MNDFYKSVFVVVKKIPYGKVCTYGDIAEYIGAKSASRMVGYAMNLSHQFDINIPAHRVVNRNGLLTGKYHFGAPTIMQQLLESEGFVIQNDKIINFEENRWYPLKELK